MGSSQYDSVGKAYNDVYDEMQHMPAGVLEEANLYAAVKDHVSEKRVLELACGSGHYSSKLLEWGASFVLGVDISPGMVEEARLRAKKLGIGEDRLQFHVADVSQDLELSDLGGPFDLVVSEWLLNYASSSKDMEGMWKTIKNNLKPGALFFGLTIPPPMGSKEELNRVHQEEWAKFGDTGYVTGEVEEGFSVHTILVSDSGGKVEFDNYYLRNEAFEKSAKAIGFAEGLDWLPFALPDSLRKAYPAAPWNLVVLNPYFRICRVRR